MLENIRLSFQGIWAHKMRSLLTMLGIIIGIAAIIAIVSTIKGTSEQIKENLVGSGNNIVNVKLYQGDWTYTSGNSSTPENMPMVTENIKKEILAVDEVTDVAAYRYGALYEGIISGTKDLGNAPVYGVDQDYFRVMGYAVQNGRLFEERDWTEYTKGVILDTVAANTLFASENPIGKTLEIKGEPFIIVGVVEQIDGFTPKVTNINDWYTYYGNTTSGQVFITDVNWPLIFSFDEPYNLVVKPAGTEAMTNAGKKTADIMNSYMPSSGEEDGSDSEDGGSSFKYKSEDLLETAKAMQEVSASTSQQLIWIASISLLVGGIGVMNIMLVSVTERTSEIGLKKAIGARKRVILTQFLTEAAVLTSMGGIIGVIAGIAMAQAISKMAQVPVGISIPAIIGSVIFSTVIGVIFGFVPSIKASNLNPIDALRHE